MDIVIHNYSNLQDYQVIWDKQKELFNNLLQNPDAEQHLILCEHQNTYTIGKSGSINNLLINEDFLKSINANVYRIERGGDITYHGPGQLVVYPILNLDKQKISLKNYVMYLEQIVIDLLEEYNIKAQLLDKATGVWLNSNNTDRKICAIGIKVSKFITMHGIALNVNTDLKYFDYINPCGFTDKKTTSMEKELNAKINFEEIKQKFIDKFVKIFGNKN